MKEYTTAYLLARLMMGTTIFCHGLVRLPKLTVFSSWMTETFKDSMIPELFVKPFSLSLPLLEFAIGLLLLAGILTRAAIMTGSILMIFLIGGSCLIEKWEWVGIQLFYGLFYVLLLVYLKYNRYSVDHYFGGEKNYLQE